MSLCFEVLPFEFLKLLTETFNIFVSHSQFQSLSRWCSKLNFQHEVESPFDFSSKREKNWFKEQITKTFNTVNQCWQNKKLLKMSFFYNTPSKSLDKLWVWKKMKLLTRRFCILLFKMIDALKRIKFFYSKEVLQLEGCALKNCWMKNSCSSEIWCWMSTLVFLTTI